MKDKNIPIQLIYMKIEGTLSGREELRFVAWLEECPEHRVYYLRIKQSHDQLEAQSVSADELDSAWSNFERRIKQTHPENRKMRYRMLLVAASVLILFGLINAWFIYRPDNLEPGAVANEITHGGRVAVLELADGTTYELDDKVKHTDNQRINTNIVLDSCRVNYLQTDTVPDKIGKPEYNRLSVPRGGEYQIQLEDGTKVWLNSDSRLRYPVAFTGKTREVFLEGEAYFEVTKNAEKPFVVYTGNQKLTVLGTGFGISNYAGEPEQQTTLVTGKVKIEFPAHSDKIFLLEPGTQIVYNKINRQITKKNVEVWEYVAWKDGKYVFSKKRLEDMLTTLSRWYDCQVFYQNPQAKEVLFSGELMRFENFDDILEMIEKSSDVKFTVNKRVVTVTK